ncbi:hypothetical protein BRADI_1g21940v3 [Brachypodium distachyon]|uniref:Uncharacterized protein n=1 Tax=Brachypodium distachyon TaxID=15368 RepID=I1GSI4_BRADI|nr:hypothetical protein BRADI_1g21940v3 [Brachypodium distachyon]
MISAVILAAVVAPCAYFFWPAVMMTAPGAGGMLIKRVAFEAYPKLYYFLLRHFGTGIAGFVFGGPLPMFVIGVLAFVFGM